MPDLPENKNFVEGLRDLDKELRSEDLPLGSLDRLKRRMDLGQHHSGRNQKLVFSTAIAVMIAFLVVVGPRLWSIPEMALDFRVVSQSKDFVWESSQPDTIEVVTGASLLEAVDFKTQLHVSRGCRFKRNPKGIQVLHGQFEFRIKPRRHTNAPVQIQVSHGMIEVTGTSFTVVQQAQQGEVRLHSGKIRFVGPSGEVVQMAAGQTLHWPLVHHPQQADVLEKTPSTSLDSTAKRSARSKKKRPRAGRLAHPSRKKLTTFEARAFMARLDEHRVQHHFAELVDLILSTLERIPDPKLQESLHFEACDLLTRKLSNRRKACQQWKLHQRKFPQSRYRTQQRQSLKELKCSSFDPEPT